MGCGISRFDSRLHDRVDGDGREDRSTKNNIHSGKGRLLFVKSSTNGGGGDGGCRRSVSSHPYNKSLSPMINHIASQQHHRCHERPNKRNSGDIENKNILERENNNLNNYGRDAEKDEDEEEEEEGGGGKCISKDDIDNNNNNNNNNNGDEMEGSSIMFRGSPSFREYCRPEDQINTNTNINDKEEEEMRKKTVVGVRRENIKNKGSGSGGVAAAVKRRVRRLRKVSPNHSPTTTT
ncbi:hypothetical protein ACP275_11G139800 [Erythranthe tilingii]